MTFTNDIKYFLKLILMSNTCTFFLEIYSLIELEIRFQFPWYYIRYLSPRICACPNPQLSRGIQYIKKIVTDFQIQLTKVSQERSISAR